MTPNASQTQSSLLSSLIINKQIETNLKYKLHQNQHSSSVDSSTTTSSSSFNTIMFEIQSNRNNSIIELTNFDFYNNDNANNNASTTSNSHNVQIWTKSGKIINYNDELNSISSSSSSSNANDNDTNGWYILSNINNITSINYNITTNNNNNTTATTNAEQQSLIQYKFKEGLLKLKTKTTHNHVL